ncbi:MAG: DUF6528 family protein [Planctomycetota bacterium]
MLPLLVALTALLLPPRPGAEPELLLTGFAEVHRVGQIDSRPPSVQSVRVGSLDGIAEAHRDLFGTTDECKPLPGGRWLVASSGGGVAVLEADGARASFSAAVPNAHSVELLPGGRLVCAASTHAEGNRLLVHDLATGALVQQFALTSAHGVHYRAEDERLYALGMAHLCVYAVDGETGELRFERRHDLPEGADASGHDLSPVPGTDELIMTTHAHVWLFDVRAATFRRHPQLGDLARVKSVDVHPTSGRIAYVQASEEHWWSESVQLLRPTGELRVPGQRFYKARWRVAGR